MRPTVLLAALVTVAAAMPVARAAGGLVLRDDFSRPTSGWADNAGHADRARGFSTYTGTGKFQMTPTDDATVGVVLAPRQAATGDVRVEADLFMYAGVGAGASGVVCRFRDARNYYGFVVSGAPGWVILKVENGRPVPLAKGALPRGVMPGAVEGKLAATCEGERLALSFGGRDVGQARDATFARGSAGLMVMGEKTAGTSAVFDTFALYDLAR